MSDQPCDYPDHGTHATPAILWVSTQRHSLQCAEAHKTGAAHGSQQRQALPVPAAFTAATIQADLKRETPREATLGLGLGAAATASVYY